MSTEQVEKRIAYALLRLVNQSGRKVENTVREIVATLVLSTSALRRAMIAIVYKRKSPDVGLMIPVSSISKSAILSPLMSPLMTVMSLAVPG